MAVAYLALEGAILLEFGGTIAADLVHFIVAFPGEVDAGRLGTAGFPDVPGAATERELASALVREQDVGRLDHIGIVAREVRHRGDAPFATNAHPGCGSAQHCSEVAVLSAMLGAVGGPASGSAMPSGARSRYLSGKVGS